MNNLLYMAPLLAFTDCTFREVYFKHFKGIDRAVAPFIVVSENSHYKKSSLKSLLPILHESVTVEPQILSKDPAAFTALVSLLEEAGFQSVNFNMGCPATAVVSRGRGSGLLPYPQNIRNFLEKSIPEINIPVSIKLRTGLFSHDEIFPILDVLNDFPLSEVIVHPRLGINKYEGPVQLDIFENVLPLIKAPVVYNGDISRESFLTLKNRFAEVSRWMIGRELLKDPFLAEDIRNSMNNLNFNLSGSEAINEYRKIKIKDFHDDLLFAFSKIFEREAALVGKMKSYWYYMESLFPGKREEMARLRKILKLDDYRKIVEIIFSI